MDIKEILSRCDHTLLRVDCTADEIRSLCDDAIRYGCASVCIPPAHVAGAKRYVGDRLKIFVDGGIRTGLDVFKCLALGADAVTVGRPLMQPLKDEGAKGVCRVLKTMTAQLEAVMYRTGSKDLKHIDPGVIWEK